MKLLQGADVVPKLIFVPDRERELFHLEEGNPTQLVRVIMAIDEPGKPRLLLDPAARFAPPTLILPKYQAVTALELDSVRWTLQTWTIASQPASTNVRRDSYRLEVLPDQDHFTLESTFQGYEDYAARTAFMDLDPLEQNCRLREQVEDVFRATVDRAEVLNARDAQKGVLWKVEGRVDRTAGRHRWVQPFPITPLALDVPKDLPDARADDVRPLDLGEKKGLDALRLIHHWMCRELTYRQIYLTPDRGWLPEHGKEVLRLRSGDCKDLSTFLTGAAKGAGMEVYPALARIVEGRLDADEPLMLYAFNHVIAAIRLEAPSGLPAEVMTEQGRFLLVDPTGRLTPFGYLPAAHRGRSVLICTPKGAAWAVVPAAATPPSRVHVKLEAEGTERSGLKGTLAMDLEAGALGLQNLALTGGTKAVREQMADLLAFPPGAKWTLGKLPDPLDDPEHFRVNVAFELPKALLPNGKEWLLPQMGLPKVRPGIQKLGHPRVLPVEMRREPEWDFEGVYRMPLGLEPVMPAGKLETPFRSATWSLKEFGGAWTLRFHQVTRGKDYDLDHREEGVQKQREDWKGLEVFLEDGLGFKVPD